MKSVYCASVTDTQKAFKYAGEGNIVLIIGNFRYREAFSEILVMITMTTSQKDGRKKQ